MRARGTTFSSFDAVRVPGTRQDDVKSSGVLFTIDVVGSVPTLLGRHRCIGENRPGPDAGLGADQVQGLDEVSLEDRVVFAHREVSDVLHFDEFAVVNLTGRTGAVLGGGEVVVIAGHQDDGALVRVDLAQLATQVVVDRVEVQVTLEGFRTLAVVAPGLPAVCLR